VKNMTAKETGIRHERGLILLEVGMQSLLDVYNHTNDVAVRQNIEKLARIGASLNDHQKNMVIGWLGKGRVTSVEEALIKIRDRIDKDNTQGRETGRHASWELADPL
jgi:hypothetical protein